MIKKHLRKYIVLLICFSYVVVILIGAYISERKISPWIKKENVVYIPDTLASKFYHEFWSIDDIHYWIIKPNDEELENILKDIETDSWSEIENHHGLFLSKYRGYFRDSNVVADIFDSNEKYICIYDSWHKEIVTNYPDVTEINSTQWLFFIYDVENNLYYCFYVTE